MTMDLKIALLPTQTVSVSASAGSGKTWLLVARIMRLLIEGVSPTAILALTFTRKACTEMQERVMESLANLGQMSRQQTYDYLQLLGIEANDDLYHRAQFLYEQLLQSQSGIRITTFHAFCQEILKRFPFEAQIPPNFELLEETQSLIEESLSTLLAQCSLDPENGLAQELENLFIQCNGLYQSKKIIKSFIDHRSDWWAFSEANKDDNTAISQLQSLLETYSETPPQLCHAAFCHALNRYQTLLSRHKNKTIEKYLHAIQSALECSDDQRAYNFLHSVFFTRTDQIRKISSAMEKSIGQQDVGEFQKLHIDLSSELSDFQNSCNKINYLKLYKSWIFVGQEALDHYQKTKLERRYLDFSDLEWHTYKLLNKTDYSHWIQFKLDAKFDHVLIDEFQDTSPTQWQLIRPIIEEIISQENSRSIFIVGDIKQSIYGFRRADPEIFNNANRYISRSQGHLLEQHISRRSSAEIIDFVNMVFQGNPQLLPNYPKHEHFQKEMWGRVEVHLPFTSGEESEELFFRNPLDKPRKKIRKSAYIQEGEYIAAKIQELINSRLLISTREHKKQVDYSDILILVRSRTNIEYYQSALQKLGIPYISDSKGTLFKNQEILDIINLLNVLISPHNNLALASVLKSPIFSCSDEDLLELCNADGPWINKLSYYVEQQENDRLSRANRLLQEWMVLADHIPIHDLLDHILFHGDIRSRYEASYSSHIAYRIQSSIAKLLDLSLQINNGRYPSLSRFLENVDRLQSLDSPDEELIQQENNRVRILTIHGAKGLESPIVFLADIASQHSNFEAKTWVEWPAGNNYPSHFLLDNFQSRAIKELEFLRENKLKRENIEEANLLYVGLTRARQVLYISGSFPSRSGGSTWHSIINNVCPLDEENPVYTLQYQQANYGGDLTTQRSEPPLYHIPTQAVENSASSISPSQSSKQIQTKNYVESTRRGRIIHRAIQLINLQRPEQDIYALLNREFTLSSKQARLFYKSGLSIVNNPQYLFLFDPNLYDRAWDELPVSWIANNNLVNGVIDRLVEKHDELFIVDYKSGEIPSEQDPLQEKYKIQLNYYRNGLDLLWPEKIKHGYLLYTDAEVLHMLF